MARYKDTSATIESPVEVSDAEYDALLAEYVSTQRELRAARSAAAPFLKSRSRSEKAEAAKQLVRDLNAKSRDLQLVGALPIRAGE